MASWHKPTVREWLKFAVRYVWISVIATFALLLFSYWDVIKLRYSSDFFANSAELNESSQRLFADGLSAKLTNSFADYLPVIITLLLTSVVAYTLYNTYKHTLLSLDVNQNFSNHKKVPSFNVALHYATLYSMAFVAPLLFWSFYLMNWFPRLARQPLSYILGSSSTKFAIMLSLILLALIGLTHLGLVMTRLTLRLFKVN